MPMTPTGYQSLTAEETLVAIQQVFINVFGSNFNLLPSSINGQFIQELTNLSVEVEAAKSLLYDGLYNPNVASGIWLDSICAWLDIIRKPATPTVVNCVCTGLSGTTIPIGSQILNTNGDVFYNENIITIPSGGSVTAPFRAALTGKIPASAGTVNRIIQQLSGWDSVTNPTDGVLGDTEQTDLSLRNQRADTLALNSSGGYESIISACAAQPNITSFVLAENYSSAIKTINGIIINPHSVYLSIYGSISDNDVANILAEKMSDGCGMQGNTTVTLVNPDYAWNIIDYTFQRAIVTPMQVNVNIVNSTSYPVDIVAQIKKAVVDNFNGDIAGISAVGMAETIYVTRFYQSIVALGVYQIIDITVGEVGGSFAQSILLPMSKMPTLTADDVVVSLT